MSSVQSLQPRCSPGSMTSSNSRETVRAYSWQSSLVRSYRPCPAHEALRITIKRGGGDGGL